jgi:hypothetical protein
MYTTCAVSYNSQYKQWSFPEQQKPAGKGDAETEFLNVT